MVLVAVLCVAPWAAAADDGSARLYQTREEQREAGQRHVLAPWLSVAVLGEMEGARETLSPRAGGGSDTQTERSASLQLGVEVAAGEDRSAEVLLEYDSGAGAWDADEAVATLDTGGVEVAAGRMYVPFGVFYSHFASGALVEFGETRGPGISVAPELGDALDLEIAAYRGRARENGDGQPWDLALGMDAWPDGAVGFGLGAISDLADSEERLLVASGDAYGRRVPGWTGSARVGIGSVQVTAEALGAARPFRELARSRDRPVAWNLEAVWFVRDDAEVAARLEGSRELARAPATQGGMALTWRPHDRVGVTVEYLRGRFKAGMSPDGGAYDGLRRVGIQVSVAF